MKQDFVGIDHVQLAAPPGAEPEARAFYAGVLGCDEIPKPAALAVRGGCWFACGTQQLHVGIEPEFRPAKKAHPALRLRDEGALEALRARLTAAGVTVKTDSESVEGVLRFFAEDPWGNRLEFLADRDD
jgi:catechol 2,3-dioxygenase-like lactoylglutathione lyase family enzyme